MNTAHELLMLVRSRHPIVGVETFEEGRLIALPGLVAAEPFRCDRRCLFLCVPALKLPPALERTVVIVPLALPGREEIKRALYRTLAGREGGRAAGRCRPIERIGRTVPGHRKQVTGMSG